MYRTFALQTFSAITQSINQSINQDILYWPMHTNYCEIRRSANAKKGQCRINP